MNLMFWKNSTGPRKLSQGLCIAVNGQFRLPPEQIDQLHYVEQRGDHKGQQVTFVRIYDARLTSGGPGMATTYDGLGEQPKAVLFEGHLQPNGHVGWLNDMRQPA